MTTVGVPIALIEDTGPTFHLAIEASTPLAGFVSNVVPAAGFVLQVADFFGLFGPSKPDNTSLILEARESLANADADASKAFADVTGADFKLSAQKFAERTGTGAMNTQLTALENADIDTTVTALDRQVINAKFDALRDPKTTSVAAAEAEVAFNKAADLLSKSINLKTEASQKSLDSQVKLRQSEEAFKDARTLDSRIEKLDKRLDRAVENHAKKNEIRDLREQMRDLKQQRDTLRQSARDLRAQALSDGERATRLLNEAGQAKQQAFDTALPYAGASAIGQQPLMLPTLEIPHEELGDVFKGFVDRHVELLKKVFENSNDKAALKILGGAKVVTRWLGIADNAKDLYQLGSSVINGDRAAFIDAASDVIEDFLVASIAHSSAVVTTAALEVMTGGAGTPLAATTYFLTASTADQIARGYVQLHRADFEKFFGQAWDIHHSAN